MSIIEERRMRRRGAEGWFRGRHRKRKRGDD